MLTICSIRDNLRTLKKIVQYALVTTYKSELSGLFNDNKGYTDLRNQIRQFVKELYKNSATIQMRARGSRRHYTIKKQRHLLNVIDCYLGDLMTANTLPQYLKRTREVMHYLLKYSPPASIFAKYCAEHESDIDAFDAAYRLLVDADQLTDYAKNDSTWTTKLYSQNTTTTSKP